MRFIPCAILCATAVLMGAIVVCAADNLSASQPYQAAKSDPVTYDVDLCIIVTAPYKTKVLKVWVPTPQTDAAQTVTEGGWGSFPIDVRPQISQDKVFGNKFAYFEFKDPQGAQIIRHMFKVTAWQLNWNIDPAKVERVEKWPADFDPYLRGESQAVVVNDDLRDVLKDIVSVPQNPFADLNRTIDWIDGNLKYDHAKASLQASSLHALKNRAGHCSDYHGLCAGFGRALGVPTRMTYGINPFPKNSPSHCKLEAYLAPYGWVSFDLSETQKMVSDLKKDGTLSDEKKKEIAAAARNRLLSGFRDNTWFLQTRGSDYELSPPAAKRAAVVRTAYVEADGVALPEPDPGAAGEIRFSWMTSQKYTADKAAKYPFKDVSTLGVK